MSNSDVETFQGKIVYNLDGSAYIIDPDNATYPNSSASQTRPSLSKVATILNSSVGSILATTPAATTTKPLKSLTLKSTSCSTNQQCPSLQHLSKGSFEAEPASSHLNPSPKIHSFRIVSAHDAVNFKCHGRNITGSIGSNRFDSEKVSQSDGFDDNRTNESDSENHSDIGSCTGFRSTDTEQQVSIRKNIRPNTSLEKQADEGSVRGNLQNPILMCFICKLSFGNTKSFSLHAKTEHSLNLQDLEKHLLAREYSSAIIQRNMDEKPQISFLEPLDVQQMMKNEQISAQVYNHPKESAGDAIMAVAMEESDATIDKELKLKEKEKNTEAHAADAESKADALVAKAETETNIETEIEAKSNGNKATPSKGAIPDKLEVQKEHRAEKGQNYERNKDSKMDSDDTCHLNVLTKSKLSPPQGPNDVMEELPLTPMVAESSKTTELSVDPKKDPLARRSSATSMSSTSPTPPPPLPHSSSSISSSTTSTPQPSTSVYEDSTHLKFLSKPNTDSSTSIRSSCKNSVNFNDIGDTFDSKHQKQCVTGLLPIAEDTANEIGLVQKQHQLQQMHSMGEFAASGGPLMAAHQSMEGSTEPNSATTAAAAALSAVALSAALSQHNHLSSLHASLAALANDPNANSVKLISDFLQHQLAQQLQEQYKHGSASQTCPEHPNGKGVDCKACELLEVQYHLRSPVTPENSPRHTGNISVSSLSSPTTHLLSKTSLATGLSPGSSSSGQTTATSVAIPTPSSAPAAVSSSSASSFTIGACSEHINGRPLGVDCSRCEMILNSARLNSGVQMSTRNSCKTLKCPQCNWHYKYQETLEIHMREKHPDGESACGYCLAGQQHPRLARGESYSCGYKPYRCEICNYSTTTKGNLSIHMQSDKHLNNMQELNSSQNMVAVAAAAAAAGGSANSGPGAGVGKMESSKMLLGNGMNMQQAVAVAAAAAAATTPSPHQQQPAHQTSANSSSNVGSSNANSVSNNSNSNKPKPSFRCDICSYETSVARNLRIHMTSEKHTHNMAVLQNNIKQIQAFSLLQQHQQATAAAAAAQQQQQQQHQQQQHRTTSGVATGGSHPQLANAIVTGNFLPEVAMADFAYNQALMIQLIHQQQQQQHHQQQQTTEGSIVKLPPTSPTTTGDDVSASGSHVQHSRQQFSPNSKVFVAEAQPSTNIEPCLSSTFAGDQEDNVSLGPTLSTSSEPDPYPQTLYSCLVCEIFHTNSLDDLNQHLLIDRTRHNSNTSSSDIVLILNNNYICRLCNYKTNLKANFQLHSKTDKHLQKLNFINHIREGGPRTHNKLNLHQQQQQQQQQSQQQQNTVQLKCNCCDYQTNSVQKLSLHTQHMRHETMRMIFQHLLNLQQLHQGKPLVPFSESFMHFNKSDNSVTDEKNSFAGNTDDAREDRDQQSGGNLEKRLTGNRVNNEFAIECQLCNYMAFSIHDMIQHVKSVRHLQVEQFVCLQRRSENLETPSMDDVFRWCGRSKSQTAQYASENCNTDEEKANTMKFTTKTEQVSPVPLAIDEETSNSFSETNNVSKYIETCMHQNHIPSIIYKCSNNCDYFSHSKQEIELHSEEVHPNCETNFITIPTNAAAIRAFQAAMAAAAVAAVANSNTGGDLQFDERHENSDDCPIAIKKERLDYNEPEPMEIDEVETSNRDTDDDQNKVQVGQPANHLSEKSGGESVGSEPKNIPTENSGLASTPTPLSSVQCPLCPDYFSEKNILEMHLMHVHSVSRDGLARLLQLVDNTIWKNISATTSPTPATSETAIHTAQSVPMSSSPCPSPSPVTGQLSSRMTMDEFSGVTGSSEQTQSRPPSTSSVVSIQSTQPHTQVPQRLNSQDEFCCQLCGSGFKHEQLLLQHAQKLQHFRMVNGEYACLASSNIVNPCQVMFPSLSSMVAHYKDAHLSLVISERHVYKYRCKQCSLAFKTQEKLTTHTLYHAMRDATKCMTCQRNFRSTQALQKHMEQTHGISSANTRESGPPNETSSDKTLPLDILQEQAHTIAMSNVEQQETNHCDKTDDLDVSGKRGEKVTKDKTLGMRAINFGDLTAQQKQQQQQVAAITAALLKQQQQQQQVHQYSSANSDIGENSNIPTNLNILQQLPMDSHSITQKYMQQQQEQTLSQNLQSLQSFQNLQHLQNQLPQLAAATAASGLPLNPVDMINLMQFHHLMSLNFMNLAPPLIFGATTGTTPGNVPNSAGNTTPTMGTRGGSGCVTPTDFPQRPSNVPATPGFASSNAPIVSPSVDVANATQLIHQQQQQQISPASATQLSNNQKRARTRITDEQLKILRAHFDINNSPSEESIMEMSQKANLPTKVVKHWFRNTLFKERQRNKDSPYNFNNPPSTTLNLEEYERTGQAKVTTLGEFSQSLSSSTPSQTPSIGEMTTSYHQTGKAAISGAELGADVEDNTNKHPTESQSRLNTVDFLTESHHLENRQLDQIGGDTARSHTSSIGSVSSFAPDVHIKTEPVDDINDLKDAKQQQPSDQQQHVRQQEQLLNSTTAIFLKQHQQTLNAVTDQQQQETELQEQAAVINASTSGQQPFVQQQQQNPTSFYNNYETKSESGSSDILSRPQTPLANPYASMNDLLSQQLDNLPMNLGNNMGPPKKFQMSKVFEKNSPSSSHFDTNSNSSNSSSTSSGKRANRTRFTDYQIKVLQEFFENNSYPKDSDLEYLSKLLLLSPRVIVVWFQNARQKQRKIYENQPNNSLYESEEKKQNITYACKKCNLVFQRYYELIRHQKNHCFKEENNKKSAKAQIAAAQIAQNLSSEDSNSSMDIHNNNAAAAAAAAASLLSGGQLGITASTSMIGSSGCGMGSSNEISTQHLAFDKSSSSLVDFSPSTTPTPPQRERSNSMENQLHPTKMKKYECDKCKLSFSTYEHFREHQLIHIMNPNLFLAQQTDGFGPFGSILQSLQQAAASNASHQHQQPNTVASKSKKRKYSETSSNADDMSSTGASFSGESSEQQSKRYDFLYEYFLQNETNVGLKNQFHAQQQQSQEPEMELEFLWNFYQQNEMRKRNSYDFLYQYYLKNEEQPQQQPNIEFLLQYYQMNESKKFFQLDASTQRIYNCTNQQQQQPTVNKASSSSNENDSDGPAAVAAPNGEEVQKDNVAKFLDSHYKKRRNQPKKYASSDNADEGINGDDDEDFSGRNCRDRHLRSEPGNFENDENINNNQVQHFGCEEYLKNNLKDIMNTKSNDREDIQTRSPEPAASPGPSTAPNSYFHNLDDFLVATMIENNQQTLTFNDANPVEIDSFATKPSKGLDDLTKGSASPNLTSTTTMPSFTEMLGITPVANSTTSPPPPISLEKTLKNNNNDSNKVQQQQQNKRLRTTILPEQLNFLYECYQNESNPSRKMLEEISKKVNLKKRVVQVWFQNSRAKDKKSRNQRFAISDDSNYDDSTRDLNASNSSCNNNNKLESLPPQVTNQQHVFSLKHLQKVKQLLEQTTMAAHVNGTHNGNLNISESEKNNSDDVVNGTDVNTNKLKIYSDMFSSQKSQIALNNNAKQRYSISNGQKSIADDVNASPGPDFKLMHHHNTHLNFNDKCEFIAENAYSKNGHNDTDCKLSDDVDDCVFSDEPIVTPTPTPISTTDIMNQIFNYNKISVIGGK